METNRVATQVKEDAHNVNWHIKMAAAALEHAAKYHTNVLSKDRTHRHKYHGHKPGNLEFRDIPVFSIRCITGMETVTAVLMQNDW
jgi:hypothetical protein